MSVFGTHIIFLIGIGFRASNNFDFSNNFMELGISGVQTFFQFISIKSLFSQIHDISNEDNLKNEIQNNLMNNLIPCERTSVLCFEPKFFVMDISAG